MIGIPVLAIIAAYVLLARFVTKRMPTRRWKWVAIAVFVLIPTGDTAVGYVYLRYLCATEAGNKIYRTAENVEGFYGTAGEDYFKFGYKYTENIERDGIYRRWTLGENGRLTFEVVPKLHSRYGYKSSDYVEKYAPQVASYHLSIYDLITGEVLATRTRLGFIGGWIYQQPGKLIGRSSGGVMTWCPHAPAGDAEFIVQTLKPIKWPRREK